ncbi:MAG TPA: hypothetical protein VMV41_10115 [Cellulomonadaceae bacterium]|nr:hypothetical protein [Cellulomonadaceae bacterium]
MSDTVHAYKGFGADMKCRGFQYAEGETFTHDGPVSLCHAGFHAVTHPLDVFGYYPPATSVYHAVEIEDVAEKAGDDSKVAGRVIKIGARIELPALIKAQIDFVFAHTKKSAAPEASSTGYQGAASSTGTRGAASSTGDQGAASSTGYQGAASSTGDQGAASSTGDQGAALATGYSATASATGADSVAIVTGLDSRAKGAIGCWLVLTERDDDRNILGVQAVPVDGKKVKADVFYTLRGGKVVAA